MKVLQMTEQAANQIKEMLDFDGNDQLRLRFGVKGGDCNGLSHSLGFDQDYDQQLDYLADIDGIPITIRKADLNIISGTTIDFKQNMAGGGFTIDNPNTNSSCDCESSFNGQAQEDGSESY